MAIMCMIGGLSGTGKSTSARNLTGAAVVNPVGKPLPFRNHFEILNGVTDAKEIIKFMKSTKEKVIIVDDFQYLLSIPYMRRIKETGWDKYNDFASNYFDVISVCAELPDDVTVYFMTHTETLEDGTETVKLIGKMLREKICIEGLFTTVLKTMVNDGKYYFITQNNGHDNVKSPLGMFDSYAIDNDLAYVDAKIRNYYGITGAVSDEVMSQMDEEAKTDLEPPKSRSERKRRSEATTTDTTTEDTTTEPVRQRKPRERVVPEELVTMGADDDREGIPFDEVETPKVEESAEPVRRRRRRD